MTIHDHSTPPTTEPVTQWTPPTGPPASPAGTVEPGKKRNPKVVVAGALVAVAVASAGVTAGVMAATDGSSSSSTTAGPGGGAGGFGGGQGGPGGGTGTGMGGALAALHGTYVVSDGNGGYATELTQTGTVSAVSAGSITVKSTDGYTKTYTVTTSTSIDNGSDQISSVASGHTVRIVASEKGVASTITDTNRSSSQTGNGQNAGGSNQGAPGAGVPGQ